MKLDQLYEALVYRGIGSGSNSRTIRWVTPDKALAHDYATHRDGKVIELQFTPKRTARLGSNRMSMTPSEFVARVVPNAKPRSKEVGIQAVRSFKEFFGEQSRPLRFYWSDEVNKIAVATFLKDLGYDSIDIDEDGKTTYGILR